MALFMMFGPLLRRFPRLRIPFLFYAYTYLDGSEKSGYGRPNWYILKFWRNTLIPFWRNYVRQDMVITQPPKEDTKYLFAAHPHGVLPLSMIVNFTSTEWNEKLPDRDSFRVLVASSCFFIPLLREIYLALGFIDASKPSATRAIREWKKNILVFVGGAAESFYPNADKLVLSRRTGFIRLAMSEGLHIVPCFSFQENDTFKLILEKDSFDWNLQMFLRRVIGIAL